VISKRFVPPHFNLPGQCGPGHLGDSWVGSTLAISLFYFVEG